MKITAVIPVFNEKHSIGNLVLKAKQYCNDVIVVDDGSTDKTADILKTLGCKYVLHADNQGQGAATRTGVNVALRLGADIIVTLDGDGQHSPDNIPLLLKPVLDNTADVVVGSRIAQLQGVPEYRKLGIDFITWLYNVGSQYKLSDSLLCLRVFKSEVLRNIQIEENRFGFCPEMLIKIRQKGYRIKDIPINCIYHDDYSLNSTYSPVRLGLILMRKTIKWRIKIEH